MESILIRFCFMRFFLRLINFWKRNGFIRYELLFLKEICLEMKKIQ